MFELYRNIHYLPPGSASAIWLDLWPNSNTMGSTAPKIQYIYFIHIHIYIYIHNIMYSQLFCCWHETTKLLDAVPPLICFTCEPGHSWSTEDVLSLYFLWKFGYFHNLDGFIFYNLKSNTLVILYRLHLVH